MERSAQPTQLYRLYTRVGRELNGHSSVNHSAKEYVTTGGFKHSNTVENFFSIFKRGIIGTYHHMSEAHFGRYCREFDMRYNSRDMNDAERAAEIVKGFVGRRLNLSADCSRSLRLGSPPLNAGSAASDGLATSHHYVGVLNDSRDTAQWS